jgi:hypothetical protein
MRTLFGDGTFHQEHEKDERGGDRGKQKEGENTEIRGQRSEVREQRSWVIC